MNGICITCLLLVQFGEKPIHNTVRYHTLSVALSIRKKKKKNKFGGKKLWLKWPLENHEQIKDIFINKEYFNFSIFFQLSGLISWRAVRQEARSISWNKLLLLQKISILSTTGMCMSHTTSLMLVKKIVESKGEISHCRY